VLGTGNPVEEGIGQADHTVADHAAGDRVADLVGGRGPVDSDNSPFRIRTGCSLVVLEQAGSIRMAVGGKVVHLVDAVEDIVLQMVVPVEVVLYLEVVVLYPVVVVVGLILLVVAVVEVLQLVVLGPD